VEPGAYYSSLHWMTSAKWSDSTQQVPPSLKFEYWFIFLAEVQPPFIYIYIYISQRGFIDERFTQKKANHIFYICH
jgi:hypothetical protein